MRRLRLFLSVVLVMVSMLVLAGPASAQAGCKAFGNAAAAEAQALGGLGQLASGAAPVNDDVALLKATFCP